MIDASSVHAEKQRDVVLDTLRKLKLPTSLLDSMIEVRNKVDKLPPEVVDQPRDGALQLASPREESPARGACTRSGEGVTREGEVEAEVAAALTTP